VSSPYEFKADPVRLIRFAKRALLVLVLAVVITWTADYLRIRFMMAGSAEGAAFDTVTFYYATALKSGKLEIYFDQPQTEVCVRSLFPHFDRRPCWYAGRSNVKRVG